jgi:hypothetical protein
MPGATCAAHRSSPRQYRRYPLGAGRDRCRMPCNAESSCSPRHRNFSEKCRDCGRFGIHCQHQFAPNRACSRSTGHLRIIWTRRARVPSEASSMGCIAGGSLSFDLRGRRTRRPSQRAEPNNGHRSAAADVERISSCRGTPDGGRETLIGPGARWRAVLEKAHAPRMVVRDTRSYGLLLGRSLGPRYLHSWYRRRNAILSGLDTETSVGLSWSLLPTETTALLHIRVPRLVVLPGSRTLANSSGRPIARGFAACTPAQSVLGQIEGLSTESIENIQVPALLTSILQSEMNPGFVC